MVTYKIKIATGTDLSAGTCVQVSIVLVGEEGESAKHQLPHKWSNFIRGAVTDFEVDTEKDLGELLLVRLSIEKYRTFNVDNWQCRYVDVTSPSGQLYQFPFYKWICGPTTVEIPEGKGVILSGNTPPVLQQQRKEELERQRSTHKWNVSVEGIPRYIDADTVEELPINDQYSYLKKSSETSLKLTANYDMKTEGFTTCKESWTDIEDIRFMISIQNSKISDVVAKIWKEDYFFGSQYLNGVNPVIIKKCSKIPENFPVGDNMVAASLGTTTSLQKEVEDGNIFLADYNILEGVPANESVNGKQQYIAAPMCLLWKNPQDQLVPIAIQLAQTPGENAPIFLPSDSEADWLLAKIWVRNSEYQVHKVVTHYLCTHSIAEAFNIATTRQLPMSHPVYKLITPHLRYTLEVNIIARAEGMGPHGFFDEGASSGKGGVMIMLRKAMDGVTYTSLCLPDDIQARGVDSIPNYLYRDDGMKIWLAVESFVSNIVHYYYKSDEAVSADPELQAWVAEIFKEGFLENKSSGIPSLLETTASLIKYLTMVIFTCSAHHAALHDSEWDFYSWMPNGPSSLKCPPPTAKGISTMQSILDALPDVNITAAFIVSLFTGVPEDVILFGDYPDVRFTEKIPQKFIKDFQNKLTEISKSINERNKSMDLPYPYLDPKKIENSITA
ncbi:hydroperoxide isomerase ALOXE3-like [Pseudophryne corroboree]|uniref:hydroperoxide isomerase ALOXE3-like n=1 Tax=Pseudophryne corroboree TaxID=495146 RepID=UPI003081B6D0